MFIVGPASELVAWSFASEAMMELNRILVTGAFSFPNVM